MNFYTGVIVVLCSHKMNRFVYYVEHTVTAFQEITQVNLVDCFQSSQNCWSYKKKIYIKKQINSKHQTFVNLWSQYSVHTQKKPGRKLIVFTVPQITG